jgi:hypothetical protein
LPCPHETRRVMTAQRHLARETRAYLLRDALLIDRNIYSGLHKQDLCRGPGSIAALTRERAGTLDQAVLASCYSGTRWFGHFLHDELPLQMLARTLGTAVCHARPEYRHERAWRSLLEVDRPADYGLLHVRRLIVIDDIGQNHGKRERYQTLRARLSDLPAGYERVYLRRSTTEGECRAPVNVAAIEDCLTREGFAIVDTAADTPQEIVRKCAGASVIVSLEGSHAVPALFLARAGACVLFICPPRRVDFILAQIAGFFGLRGALFIGEPVANSEESFSVDPDELAHAIDGATASARSVSLIAY